MSEEKQSSLAVPASLILTIIVATGSIAWVYRGLEPSRPQESLDSSIRDEVQAFDARLWQDPLEPVEDLLAVEAQSFRARPDQYRLGAFIDKNPSVLRQQDFAGVIEELHGLVESGCRISPDCMLTILGISLPDSPYALSVEKRRRIRYAVVSALTSEFLPMEADRIGIVRIGSNARDTVIEKDAEPEATAAPTAAGELASDRLPKLLAFETFENQVRNEARYVVVLWIPTSVYRGDLERLEQLIASFSPPMQSSEHIRTVLLGPTDSDELAAFARNLASSLGWNLLDTVRRVGDALEQGGRTIDLERAASIIAEASWHLEEGLPRDASVKDLMACLAPTESQAGIADCLNAEQIDDSDSRWHESVARDWWRNNTELRPSFATWREDQGLAFLRADIASSLDFGLHEDQLTTDMLGECLEPPSDGTEIVAAFTRCLNVSGSNIVDSDGAWAQTIADRHRQFITYPGLSNDIELAAKAEGVSPDKAGSIIAAASDYLGDQDRAIPPGLALAPLVDCLTPANTVELIAGCLAKLELVDSASGWRETLARNWLANNSQEDTERYFEPDFDDWATTVTSVFGEELAVDTRPFLPDYLHWRAQAFAERTGSMPTASIIAAADGYLDDGFPNSLRMEELVTCLSEAETERLIASCLEAQGIPDSDSRWFETVAQEWWTDNRAYVPSFSEWRQRSTFGAASLRQEISAYLDNGLPEGVLTELDIESCRIDASNSQSPIAAFATCVQSGGEGISDSNEYWAITLAEYFSQSIVGPEVAQEIERYSGELDADLERVGSIIAGAGDYLDNGIPGNAAIGELVACLNRANTEVLTASCLESLNLPDDDSDWHESVAAVWWQNNSSWPQFAEWKERSALPAADLRAKISAYLDEDLPDDVLAASGIEACRDRATSKPEEPGESAPEVPDESTQRVLDEFAACLEEGGRDVEDSDPIWYYTVANDFLQSVVAPNVPSEVERYVAEQGASLDRIGSIVAAASDYLDNGIPGDTAIGELVACLQQANTAGLIASCLDGTGLSDSDELWYVSVAERWWEDNGRATPDPAQAHPEQIRELVERLEDYFPPRSTDLARIGSIVAAASYYVGGSSPAAADPLVACLRIARVNSDLITSCLDSHIEDDVDYSGVVQEWVERNAWAPASPDSMTVFSTQATIPERMLQERMLSQREQDGAPMQTLADRITPTISDDSYLARALYDELIGRGIDRRERIALVFEQDTQYGRALADLLDCNATYWTDYTAEDRPCFDNAVRYGYIRGLDGAGSRTPDSNSSSTARPSTLAALGASSIDAPPDTLEDPVGAHQFDYLRRLARDIARTRPAAIGVLGTDVFDKKLVLQALRAARTGAVVFTTDLESVFEDRDERRWTRNLIIASSHDLVYPEGGCPGRDRVSPRRFRDNYQVSYFLATCAAALVNGQDINLDILNSDVGVYEVGLRGIVALTRNEFALPQADASTEWRLFAYLLPQALGWLLVLSPLIGAALWYQLSKKRASPKLAMACWAVLAALVAILVWQSLEPYGDPVRVGAGVSAWPTFVLQVTTIVLAIAFLVQSRKTLERNGEKIVERYGLGPAADIDGKSAASLWYKYRNRSSYAVGKARVVTMWMAISAVVLIAYGPLTPHPNVVRGLRVGDFAIPFETAWVTVIALIAVLGYACFCFDQMIRCAAFVRYLAKIDPPALAPLEFQRQFARHRDIAAPVATLELIGDRTEAVVTLIVWPLALLCLLVLSGSGIFEGWSWSPWLVGTYILLCCTILFAAIELQRAAEAARSTMSSRLKSLRLRGPDPLPRTKSRREPEALASFNIQVDAAMERIGSLRKGAFIDWFRHPLLKAILLPSTAPAILLLIQALFY